jgi:hypothetical protein
VNYKCLVAFDCIPLAPGEEKTVALRIDPTLLSIYDESKDGWDLLPGEYKILAGPFFERNTAHHNVPYRKVKQIDAASHLTGGRIDLSTTLHEHFVNRRDQNPIDNSYVSTLAALPSSA